MTHGEASGRLRPYIALYQDSLSAFVPLSYHYGFNRIETNRAKGMRIHNQRTVLSAKGDGHRCLSSGKWSDKIKEKRVFMTISQLGPLEGD